MPVLPLVRSAAGGVLIAAAGWAAAATSIVAFPEVNGPATPSGPFPQPPIIVATRTYTVPAGEQVVSAEISGLWGSSGDPNSTAGVDVVVNGVVVATCVKPDPACWSGEVGQRPWNYKFQGTELVALNGGAATMSAVQTSDLSVRLGVSTLVIETAPPPIVPALSPLGLAALAALMAAAFGYAARRIVAR
jgi:hypothetical protein